MSVRMRHTKGHTGNRRSHHALIARSVVRDAKTGALGLPHRLDESTGMYRGKLIVAQKEHKKEKKTAEPHGHVHAEKAAVAEHAAKTEGKKGVIGKLAQAARPRSRSGMGGGA